MSLAPAHPVRVRFAPSPTGFLHIGNARTALFNYLYARSSGGAFILRIEDTDLERSSGEHEEALNEDLRWLGLEWDEGPDAGGPHGPYRQSERLDIYRGQLDKLTSCDKAYRCFCSSEQLERRRQSALSRGDAVVYDGRCGCLSAAESRRMADERMPFSIRYRVPDELVVIDDLVRGRVAFDASLIGDTVIWKSDGMPTFHFAVTVDDALMEVSCVLRGEGHLSNAPVQVLLAKDLGFEAPVFAHMSQTLAPGGGKLSKRRGAMSLREFREKGYPPEAVVNYMALLGWSPGGGREIFTLEEAVGLFDVRDLTKSPAFFDSAKFSYVCRKHMQSAEPARLAALARPFLEKAGLPAIKDAFLERLVETARQRAEKIEDFASIMRPYIVDGEFDEGARAVLRDEKSREVLSALARSLLAQGGVGEDQLRAAFKEAGAATGRQGAQLYMPARAALTGSTAGAEILEVIPILGFEKVIERLEKGAGIPRGAV